MERQSNVLIVDDDEFALRSMSRALVDKSYQVVTATSGSEAIDLLRKDTFDLVLTDLKMPGMDGLEVLRQARKIAPQAVVLILTGYASMESAVEALREGAYDYLVKPCSADELRLKIVRGLERVRLAKERQQAEEALRESEARLTTILDSLQSGVVVIDAETHEIVEANPAAVEMFAAPREQIVGRVCHAFICPTEVCKCPITHLGQAVDRSERVLVNATGENVPVLKTVIPIILDGREHLVENFIDITERVRTEHEIEERRMYLEGVLGAAPDAIVTLDAHLQIVEWNPGAERLFGYSLEEAVGQNLDHLVISPDVSEEVTRFKQIIMNRGEVPPTETIRYRKDGSPVDVIVAASPILVGGKFIGVVAVYTDITARVRMEEALRALALLDELTGLYNRRGFVTLAKQQLKTANRARRRMMLLFADFDGLKQINDTFGHPEGDRALIEIADVLRETFRESDIIARFAGDEFVVLAIETDSASPEALTARLQQNLEVRNARGDHPYTLSLSVGVARYDPEHPCSIDDLLTQADRAMYGQKQNNTPG